MPQEKFDSTFVNKRIDEIKYSIEMLKYGLCELEAVYLRLQSGAILSENEKNETQQNATVLNARSHNLAHSINNALKEVESNLKLHTSKGLAIDKEVMREFSAVLRESISTLQHYYQIHETYHDRYKEEKSDPKEKEVPIKVTSKSKKDKSSRKKDPDDHNLTAMQKFGKLMRRICLCGAGSRASET